ncbi:UV radiation resistance protein and autophagy-related subunit 14-domain-containing protein [Mycena floridula]|nr:UV radiation resistance protein and autophagy-related subunit 14-domain-containing protein [Mycena floridula]
MAGNTELAVSVDPSDKAGFSQRRLRHITAIEIRNFSPFPVRDAFASALSQPAEQSQFTAYGHLSDDMDLTMSRKRGRRVSANSITTLRSAKSDELTSEDFGNTSEAMGRRRTGSRAATGSFGASSGGRPYSASSGTIRPHRVRTSSITSSLNSFVNSSAVPFSAALSDNSQAGLEKVIKSRLVETFIAVTVPPITAYDELESSTVTPSTPFSQSISPNGREKIARISPKSPVSPGPRPSKSHVTSSSQSTLGSSSSVPLAQTPDYLSPIHQPSTNPIFTLDPPSQFMKWTDLGSETLDIEVWAKVGVVSEPRDQRFNGKPKGKEKEPPALEWKIMEEWNVNLSELCPVPDDVSTYHSNTLIINLGQPGQDYYLPPRVTSSRPPTPTSGYASDPERDSHQVNVETPTPSRADFLDVTALSRRRGRRRQGIQANTSTDLTKTAGWQDLFKLVTLQSCILDNKSSLDRIVSAIEKARSDPIFALRREVSSRECELEQIRIDCKGVEDRCSTLRDELASRRERLRERKDMLALAEQQLNETAVAFSQAEDVVLQERSRLQSLRKRIAPTRTTLLSTLSSLFPIDLLSPPDLLFTILDVPLPIPLSATDPAPPLSLATHKEVTEESIATSLGYAAQVVNLIAAYLGKGLVYPVTCIGSRSLIRDGISAMVGPRMFPLFSRGVDTYRFEYGVFLLNKNIEMLMGDQDLRALDMRHTLPNLKNLLLTLTSGEAAPLNSRPLDSPVSSVSGLESPRAESPTTPKASDEEGAANGTPPASGSSTPTATEASKKTRPFLGITFTSTFLRSRYGSVSAKGAEETFANDDGPGSDAGSDNGADDDDRRTIRESEPLSTKSGPSEAEKESTLFRRTSSTTIEVKT